MGRALRITTERKEIEFNKIYPPPEHLTCDQFAPSRVRHLLLRNSWRVRQRPLYKQARAIHFGGFIAVETHADAENVRRYLQMMGANGAVQAVIENGVEYYRVYRV